MSEFTDDKFWYLKFSTEVSARYHDWRRATLGTYVTATRAVALVGSVFSLIALFAMPNWLTLVVGVSCAVIALVTLVDLVFRFDDQARRHNDIYRRFKELQEDIARRQADWRSHYADWEAVAQGIRKDEPPVFWAIYATSWNQAIDRNQADKSFGRHVSRWRGFLGSVVRFRPEDFPFAHAA